MPIPLLLGQVEMLEADVTQAMLESTLGVEPSGYEKEEILTVKELVTIQVHR